MAGAVLGGLTALGGLALTLALFSTDQPPGQTATAAVLSVTGIINVLASRGIRDERERAILAGGLATAALLGYLAASRDFGELFWIHAGYLVLLASRRLRRGARVAAP